MAAKLPSERRPGRSAYRAVISDGPLARIENSSVPQWRAPSGFSPDLQVVLTYEGLFRYSARGRQLLVDSNQILLVGGDEEFRDEHLLKDVGHAGLIITPSKSVVEELLDRSGWRGSRPPESVVRPASSRARLTASLLLASGGEDPLRGEENLIAITRDILAGAGKARPSGGSAHVQRAKELLHAYPFQKLSLTKIASQVGLSPVYLTQLFKEAEGVPLYKYQLQLRLNRALIALPSCDDITSLAFDLGFSSHSHFSESFRSAFGMTPSQFRATTRS